MRNNINNIKFGDKDTLGNSNGNMNIIKEKENYNNINNYSRDENDNINNNNNIDNIENQNENLQKGKSIQIDYEPKNLIDMKRFISALNHKIQVDDNNLIYIFREIRPLKFRRNNLQSLIVGTKLLSKTLSTKRNNIDDFPIPLFPIKSNLKI